MLLAQKQNLEDIVIKILAEKNNANAEQILQICKKIGHTATIQGIYRVLRKLQVDGVIVKNRQVYAIRLPWLSNLEELIQKMKRTYTEIDYIKNMLPQNKRQRSIWRFNNLLNAYAFWTQMLLTMPNIVENKFVLSYRPHAWCTLLPNGQNQLSLLSLLSKIGKNYLIIGDRTYLDKYSRSLWKGIENHNYYLAERNELYSRERFSNFFIIGEFIVSIIFDKKTAHAIDELFKKTPLGCDLDYRQVGMIYNRKANIRLTIKRDQKKVNNYLKKFENVFGPIT